jgi:hypothetical protein
MEPIKIKLEETINLEDRMVKMKKTPKISKMSIRNIKNFKKN